MFEFGTDVRERFCFFTPIHMEGKTFLAPPGVQGVTMAFCLEQDCRIKLPIFVFSDGRTGILTPRAPDGAKNQHLVG